MRKLTHYSAYILCLLFSVSSVAIGLPASNTTTAAPSSTQPQLQSPLQSGHTDPKPKITGFTTNTCVKPKSFITVLGNNFGSQKDLALVVGSSHISLKISTWSSGRITAYLPSNQIKPGTRYPVGIRKRTDDDVWFNTWLSNTDKTITICSSTPKGSAYNKTTAPENAGLKIVEPSPPVTTTDDPPTGRPDNSADSDDTGTDTKTGDVDENNNGFDTTQTILPGNSGLLMNRQLPTPPKLSITPAADSTGNAIAEPNELLVVSSNMEEAKQLAQQLNSYGLSPKKRKVLKNLGIVMTTYRVPTDIDIQQTAINIRQAYPDMWADINHRYTLQSDTRSTTAAKKQINWNTENAECGKGLRIGLVDTEINTEHPALKTQHITSHSVLSQGIKKAKKSHATAIATLLIGSNNSESFSGMLPAAKLFSAAVFRQRDKKNMDTTAEWIVNALDWLLSQNVQVINMSVGGPRNLLVDIAIQRTLKSGIPVIAAAGNSGHSATAVYPAAQTGVIAVTAIDSEMKIYSKANYGEYIDFAAPGVDIWAGNEKGTGKFVSGTSFAVPFVTAAIASSVNNRGHNKTYLQLQNNATDLGVKGKDKQFGWGMLQVSGTCL